MEVVYYHARSHNRHMAVVWLIHILPFLCGLDRCELYKRRYRSTSLSRKDTIDDVPCFVCKMKCHNNVMKCLDGLLATHTITSRLVLGKSHSSIYFFQKVSYDSCRMCLILLPAFVQCIIALSISTSLGSAKAYRICIQLITAIILHPQKSLLHGLSDLWLSLYITLVPYMNHAFPLDMDPATSWRDTRTRARPNK